MTAMSPEDIAGTRFPTRARGYDRDSVEDFLERVAEHYRRALGNVPRLEPYRQLGEEVGEFLQHASETAERIRLEAEQELRAAQRTAESLIERARGEAERIKRDGEREAEELLERARAGAEEMQAEAERLARLARADATVVDREARRAAEQLREEALKDATKTRAAAEREARIATEKSERRVRRLQNLEFALAKRVSAAEAKLHTLSTDGERG